MNIKFQRLNSKVIIPVKKKDRDQAFVTKTGNIKSLARPILE